MTATNQRRAPPQIEWTRPRLERFKEAFLRAPGDDNAIFQFEGFAFRKRYAYDLIEKLDEVLILGPNDSMLYRRPITDWRC